MRYSAFAAIGCMLVIGLGLGFGKGAQPEDDVKPIKEVMAEAMKGGLQKKIVKGDASDEEKMKFLDMMISLVENDPPKGDPTEWKMAAGTAMMNAAKVVVGREGAAEALAESTNCMACHAKFKPSD